MAGSITLTAGGDNTITAFSGTIQNGSGTVSLTKAGTGTLTLSGNSTNSGTTTVSAGTIKLGATGSGVDTPLGTSGVIVSSGAVLDLNGYTLSTALPLTLNGIGIASGGALINSSASAASYSGQVTLGSATSIIANNGSITLSDATDPITGAYNLTLGGTGNGTIDSPIQTGTGTITKTGSGTWTLNGVNTYTGATLISAGELQLGVAETNLTAVTDNSTLDLDGNNQTIGSLAGSGTVTSSVAGSIALTAGGDNTNTSFSGIIQNGSGTVSLTKAGTGTLTLSGNSTNSGTTTISAGTIKLGATGSGADTPLGTTGVIVSSGAVLDLNGYTLSAALPLMLNGTGIASGGALINSSASAASYSGQVTLGSATSIIANSGNITLSR